MSNRKTPEDEDHAGQADVTSSDGLVVQEGKQDEELLTRLKYMQADFENYRKRTEKELRDVEEASVRNLVVRLLSVVDELELAVEHSEGGSAGNELTEGVEMVHKNLVSALESVGLRRIVAVGKVFDPALHEAVEKTRGRSAGADIVVEEIRPGYTFRGQVIRPSMVKVELAKKAAQEEAKAIE
ncbi:MAG: nucleotide exchange factor GrpE [Thaumarchaeota archaeon]|nr:nucleotide exchange factor GrpE [Nitrososphaerota archaeon]